MPKYRRLCKEGEEPTTFVGGEDFAKLFDTKNAFGPVVTDKNGNEVLDCDLRPVLKWNRCWSDIPVEWVPAVQELFSKIRAKYRVEGVEDDPDDPGLQVRVDQVKDKFGTLRFYYTVLNLPNHEERVDRSSIKNQEIDGRMAVVQIKLHTPTKAEAEIYDDIDEMIAKCEERLKKDDPYYGEPY